MSNIIDKRICTGCTACYNVCPISAIEMKRDDDGFLYPEKTDRCIECGKCERICPRINTPEHKEEFVQKAYAALSKDHKVWRNSSSGGASMEIMRALDDGNTVFVGAAWDGLKVYHTCVETVDEAKKFYKSKYIASDLGKTFSDTKRYLECGKNVVFCGTPCQVAGLRAFLGKEHENLFLIDLICHGVGSPRVFDACIDILEKQFKCKINSYDFRFKQKTYQSDHIQRVTMNDGSSLLLSNDPYIQLFTKQICLRSSCGKNCIYRTSNREGDITIGDYKHLSDVFPNLLGTKRNYSTIVINSIKGEKVLPKLQKAMVMLECSVDVIKKYNPIFARHTFFCEDRDEFFAELSQNEKEAILRRTTPAKCYKYSVKRKIFDLLPMLVRRKLLERW